MTSRPQDQVGLILCLFKITGVCPDVDREAGVHTLHAQKYRQGDNDEIVLVLPQNTADLLDDPNYHEFVITDTKVLPDGVHAEKQLLR